VRREALVETGSAALLDEPFRKCVGGECAAVLVEQEDDVLARGRGVDGLDHRADERDRYVRAGLLLHHMDGAIADMAAAKPDHIGDACGGAEQQRQREPRFCAERVRRLEGGDVLLAPNSRSALSTAEDQARKPSLRGTGAKPRLSHRLHPHACGRITITPIEMA
jgi:hypothetical protein